MKQFTARVWASLLALSLLLSLAACGGKDATAATMHLRRTEGTVSVSDGGGKDVPVLENLGLYSGYGVDTRSASYAWIDLDEVKLTKLDQNSEISIQKEGKALEIEVKSGSLFFSVTEPLEDDETLNIRTSTMLVGIRGTCGWVEDNDGLSRVYLLEGKVECSAEGRTVRVNAGEFAQLTADGELVVEQFDEQNIPAFVQNEVDPELPGGAEETPDNNSDLTSGVLEPKRKPNSSAPPETSEAPAPTPEPAPTDTGGQPSAPVYLLTREVCYGQDELLVVEWLNQYDARGYVLSVEEIWYNPFDGSPSSLITTYEYTGEPGQCRVIPDRQLFESEEEWLSAQVETFTTPGTPGGLPSHLSGYLYSVLADQLYDDALRAAVLSNGGVLTKEAVGYASEDWAYAVYTFDEADNPISIVTYDDAGAVTGTAALEWRLLDVT